MCSIAIRLSYGNLDYFTGGDLTSDTEESGELWQDIETPVARAAGPVDVAVADHHAYFDAAGPNRLSSGVPRCSKTSRSSSYPAVSNRHLRVAEAMSLRLFSRS
jgi:hypothetical protein